MFNQQLSEEDCNDGKNELDIYLEEGFKLKTKMGALEYWKLNASRFPKLARMASDILSIPITTVASESTFSIGGRILQKYRNCLLPETVQALICTRNWLRGFKEAKISGIDIFILILSFAVFVIATYFSLFSFSFSNLNYRYARSRSRRSAVVQGRLKCLTSVGRWRCRIYFSVICLLELVMRLVCFYYMLWF